MRQSDLHPTKHHILPSSRGGSDKDGNIAIVKRGLHRKYHALFENRTPTEIIDFLTMYFWNGNKDFLYDYITECDEDKVSINKIDYFKTAS